MNDRYLNELKNYDGREIRLMEVCGSHTAAIGKLGIREVISPKIKLISGPGCPVCVCPSSYIDKLISLAEEGKSIVTFGDMLRVPGSRSSLYEAKGRGAEVIMVYSPLDIIEAAEREPQKDFVFAAVGFETTIPAYTLLLDEVRQKDIKNIKLLTALKTMPPVIDCLCGMGADIDGFIAPGHVSVITGAGAFYYLAEKYDIPFAVTGFKDDELIAGIWGLLKLVEGKERFRKRPEKLVRNFYSCVVTEKGNERAKEKIDEYFKKGEAVWRGIGSIADSGLYLRDEFMVYDAGSRGLFEDRKLNEGCCCDKVLTGRMEPNQCPLFAKTCSPLSPQGACMVSSEGSCYQSYKGAVG